jgi:gas vesicle protein
MANKTTNRLVVGLLIGLVLGGIAGYIITNNFNKNNFQKGPNLQIDDNTKNKIASFFDSTSDINQINAYCEQNKAYCLYYCRNINQNHEICKELLDYTKQGEISK